MTSDKENTLKLIDVILKTNTKHDEFHRWIKPYGQGIFTVLFSAKKENKQGLFSIQRIFQLQKQNM